MDTATICLQTPIGTITITADEKYIRSITLEPVDLFFSSPSPASSKKSTAIVTVTKHSRSPLLKKAAVQFTEYFEGTRKKFTLPLDYAQSFLPEEKRPTEFRQTVWHTLCTIPYGETRSYKEIAAAVENENAVRAVGSAIHANPFLIIVPCHRVINANNALGEYVGGALAKRYLLHQETIHCLKLPSA
jgi:methylated-DNA-[protein]-cysteine S-methyltransferase